MDCENRFNLDDVKFTIWKVFCYHQKSQKWQFIYKAGNSLTLVYSSTNMFKSVWTNGFWKPLVHFTHIQLVCSIISVNKLISVWMIGFQYGREDSSVDEWISVWTSGFQCGRVDFSMDKLISVWTSGFQCGRVDFSVDEWISVWTRWFQCGRVDFSVDEWISVWKSGFQCGRVDFSVDEWVSVWTRGFQCGQVDFSVDERISVWTSGFQKSLVHLTSGSNSLTKPLYYRGKYHQWWWKCFVFRR